MSGGSFRKRLPDGTIVISSYLDPGETEVEEPVYHPGQSGNHNGPTVDALVTVLKTSDYTAHVGAFVLVDASSGPVTITLPSAVHNGSEVGVKKVDASTNRVTIQPQGSVTIDDDSEAILITKNAGATFLFDGTEWVIQSLTGVVSSEDPGSIYIPPDYGGSSSSAGPDNWNADDWAYFITQDHTRDPHSNGQPRFTGNGPPPVTITGAVTNDVYLDLSNGKLYKMT